MSHKIVAIVPAFNEEANIASVINDLRQHQPAIKIVVINDCSEDATGDIVRRLNETVINLVINLGIGGAVQTGLKYARDNDYDIAIQFDGDGQHMAAEIEKIVRPVIDGEADVVIGSRFLGGGGFKSNIPRRIGIGVFRWVNSILVRNTITDNTSGFRAYNKSAIEFLAQYYPQDYPEPEAVVELYRNRFRIREVAVAMKEREGGRSSIKVFGSVYYMVKVLMASLIAFSRKPCFKEKKS
jgi:glycosyltransferase involved in cell wall biosynthesis